MTKKRDWFIFIRFKIQIFRQGKGLAALRNPQSFTEYLRLALIFM